MQANCRGHAMNIASWSLPLLSCAILLCAGTIAVFGVRMTRAARDLAHRTGMGEVLVGAVLVGAATSLSGITTSVTAAWSGHAGLAVSNALGGIAAQTAFLAIADIVYRRANLEHAAASVENLVMCAFLLCLLGIHVAGAATRSLSFFGIHPATALLVIGYLFGLFVLMKTHRAPMWIPRHTGDTRPEQAGYRNRRRGTMTELWLTFAAATVAVTASGWLLAQVAVPFAVRTGLSESFIGGTLTAIATSLPELIIAVTAVRMGALNLAVGDIVGGNAFDTLFIAVSDIAYRAGPIYGSISGAELLWLAISILMTAVLLMGLLYRERHGIGNIGVESVLLAIIYLGGASLVFWLA
jgi:cation:H+ antiporter